MNLYTESESEIDIIDPQTQMHYAILSSFENTKFPQRHDFFEFFLLAEGTQQLDINGHLFSAQPGALVLIRPGDIHTRRYLTAGYHINVAFSAQIAQMMFSYLGEGYPSAELLQSTAPLCITLTEQEKNTVRRQLTGLNAISLTDKSRLRTNLRVLILEMFVHYFARCVDPREASPHDWFHRLLREMEQPENLSAGLPALLAHSQKSHEYLCRSFRERLHCTPTAYINSLRLNYVANSLIHSNLDITSICLNAGFESISHFHHLFKKQYGISPLQFRQQHQHLDIYSDSGTE